MCSSLFQILYAESMSVSSWKLPDGSTADWKLITTFDDGSFYYDAKSIKDVGYNYVAVVAMQTFDTPKQKETALNELKVDRKKTPNPEYVFRDYSANQTLYVINIKDRTSAWFYYRTLDSKQNVIDHSTYFKQVLSTDILTKQNIVGLLQHLKINKIEKNSWNFFLFLKLLDEPNNPYTYIDEMASYKVFKCTPQKLLMLKTIIMMRTQ